MSYFQTNYKFLEYPIETEESSGFRNAQLGALHAIGAHFTISNQPAIIVMPTGSGKTAVLIASTFLIRPQRVLIITPSRLVREQIAEEFTSLETLKKIGAVSKEIPLPKVWSIKSKITLESEWNKIKEYDIVVSALPSINHLDDKIPEAPTELFDLIIVDEAHHSPARTWNALLEHFNKSKRILLTATPFRSDRKEIIGRFTYNYPLKKAYEDGIFGEIQYHLVDSQNNNDLKIALEAEKIYIDDKSNGYNHKIFVRTDSKIKAKELLTLYSDNTSLKLKLIMGSHSLSYIKRAIKELSNNTLDGIVCVNMLGEGFNYPQLKIAAIHSPHKSLAVTLQFIGRFARTGGDHLGAAKFLAVPTEIEFETEKLYSSGSVWKEIVTNLSASRVEHEERVREVLDEFYDNEIIREDELKISLYNIRIYHHVKIFTISSPINLQNEIKFNDHLQTIYFSLTENREAAIYIRKEIQRPLFNSDDSLEDISHEIIVLYFNKESSLLFIATNKRVEGFYDFIVQQLVGNSYSVLPLSKINRALNGLKNAEFYNIGMRNRIKTSSSESYRIVSGSSADRAIQVSDSRLYHRGHCFGKATDGEKEITIGLSSASKIWSNTSSQIPVFIKWCEVLSAKILNPVAEKTNSGLDLLSVGKDLDAIPADVMLCDWDNYVYNNNPNVEFKTEEGNYATSKLLDSDIHILSTNKEDIIIEIVFDKASFSYVFSINDGPLYKEFNPSNVLKYQSANESINIVNLLNEYPLTFFTSNLSSFSGRSIFLENSNETIYFDTKKIIPIKWEENNVHITKEYGDLDNGKVSIQNYLSNVFENDTNYEVVYHDHGSGEIADFITISKSNHLLDVNFYHCKASGGDKPGDRVDDLYEVCGQSVKCLIFMRPSKLYEKIKYRFENNKGVAKFISGDIELLKDLLLNNPPVFIKFNIVVVQPGIDSTNISPKQSNILAATDDYLKRDIIQNFYIWGS